MDLLDDSFSHLIHDANLINVEPNLMIPTWRNKSLGNACVAKRLDRFLLVEHTTKVVDRYKY